MPGRSRRRAGSVPEGGTQASRPRDGRGALASASHRVQAPGSSQRTRVETQGKARHTAETPRGTAPRKAKPAPPRRLRQAAQYGETDLRAGRDSAQRRTRRPHPHPRPLASRRGLRTCEPRRRAPEDRIGGGRKPGPGGRACPSSLCERKKGFTRRCHKQEKRGKCAKNHTRSESGKGPVSNGAAPART